jgi:hypothetical protein
VSDHHPALQGVGLSGEARGGFQVCHLWVVVGSGESRSPEVWRY